MTQQHPITPPPELVEQWIEETRSHDCIGAYPADLEQCVATRAAQWGADQELEACCEWMKLEGHEYEHKALFAARRPKPPSLKEQALIHFDSYAASFETSGGDSDLIRRALEQLPDNE
jgi:hypothetical protein